MFITKVNTIATAQEMRKYNYWSSDQVCRFLECGNSFCQMLAHEEGVYFKIITVPVAQIRNKVYKHKIERV